MACFWFTKTIPWERGKGTVVKRRKISQPHNEMRKIHCENGMSFEGDLDSQGGGSANAATRIAMTGGGGKKSWYMEKVYLRQAWGEGRAPQVSVHKEKEKKKLQKSQMKLKPPTKAQEGKKNPQHGKKK